MEAPTAAITCLQAVWQGLCLLHKCELLITLSCAVTEHSYNNRDAYYTRPIFHMLSSYFNNLLRKNSYQTGSPGHAIN